MQASEALEKANEQLEQSEQVCPGWDCPNHDLALFMAIQTNGCNFLDEIKRHEQYKMQTLKVNKQKLMKRAEWAALIIKNH